MESRHCCAMMTTFADWRCDQHPPHECADYLIGYDERSRHYRILIHDGEDGDATSGITIQFCPWCGAKLPAVIDEAVV